MKNPKQDLLTPELISRREALKRSGLLAGGFVFIPALAGFLKGCTAQTDYTMVVLSQEQSATIQAIMDVIIPETDTPSASQVGVPAFLDQILNRNSSQEDRDQFMSRFDSFTDLAAKDLGMPFSEASPERQYDFLMELHKTASGQGEIHKETSLPDFFMMMKYVTVVGYFTSEPGATQVLRYEAAPGPYRGCVPFEEVGRTWAT